jgi:hypothetical protein
MAKKTIEFMGMKLDLSGTKQKVNYERKHGSPMKEIFRMMSMYGVMESMQNGEDMSNLDFSRMDMMSLDFMSNLLHAGAQKFNANVSLDVMYDLIDLYLEDKTIFDLMGVTMELLEQAGYLNFGNDEEQEAQEEAPKPKRATRKPKETKVEDAQ